MESTSVRAVEALSRALRAVARDQLDILADREPPTVTVARVGTRRRLTPFWAGEGFPADVRSTLRTIADTQLEGGATPVVVARRLSPGARGLLAEHRTSWADESGAIDLAAGPFLIRAPGTPDPSPGPPTRFTPAAGAIAEVLLTRAVDGELVVPPVAELADTVGVSRGATSRALTFFDSRGWTASTGPRRGPTARRELTERGTVLDAWSRWYASRQDDVVPAHAVIRDADEWIEEVVATRWEVGTWAVTGLAALDHRAPYATTVNPIDLYLEASAFDDELDRRLDVLDLAPTGTGARVRVLRADRLLRLPAESNGTPLPLVGDIRLYGDLLRRGGVRGGDYANHLREQRIGF